MSSYIEKLKEKMGGGNKEEAKEKAKKLDERDPEKSVKKQKEKPIIIKMHGKEFKVVPGYGDGDLEVMTFSKGGRAGYKSGMKVCKLAKRGKGKAYGKNS